VARPRLGPLALALAAALALRAPAPPAARAAGDSQIDEGAADELPARGEDGGADDLAARLRDYAAGSLAKFDEVKSAAVAFRRQGWFPSCWLRDPDADVGLAAGPGGRTVTVVVSCARRDIDHRLVLGPLERFLLPGADRRFFGELAVALASASPEIARARLRFSFAALDPRGRVVWEDRGAIAITAAAARSVPAGQRTQRAVWPLLDENTVPESLWPEGEGGESR